MKALRNAAGAAKAWVGEHLALTAMAALTSATLWHTICTVYQLAVPLRIYYLVLLLSLGTPFLLLVCLSWKGVLEDFKVWFQSYFWHVRVGVLAALFALSTRIQFGADEYPWELTGALFCAFATVLGMMVLVATALKPTPQPKDGGLELLHHTVLLLGITAGTAVGLFVGVEGMHRLYMDNTHPSLYQKVTESYATGTVAGALIAVFVAVGGLVFVLEHKLSDFHTSATKMASKLEAITDTVEGLESNAIKVVKQLQGISTTVRGVGSEVAQRAGDLLNILHTHLQLQKLPNTIKDSVVSFEAWYFSSWFGKILSLKDGSQSQAVSCAIAKSYWCEEASDIGRWELVTNSRNYAAFLISAVTGILKSAPSQTVYFYTSTPVAPFFLLNCPFQTRSGWGVHGLERFLNEYMSFVRDVVAENKNLVHRRYIWTIPDRKAFSTLPPSFRDWFHYPYGDQTFRKNWKILGVPISGSLIVSHPKLFDLSSLNCENGNCHGILPVDDTPLADLLDFENGWQDSKKGLRDSQQGYKAFPLVNPAFDDDTVLQTVIDAETDALRTKLWQVFAEAKKLLTDALLAAEGSNDLLAVLVGDEAAARTWEGLVNGIPKIGGNEPAKLPPAYEIIACMQALGAVCAARGVAGDGFLKLEDLLLSAKWWEWWNEKYPARTVRELPVFSDFFDQSFHSQGPRRHPEFVNTTLLAQNPTLPDGRTVLKDFQDIGPEFAMVGVSDGSRDRTSGTHIKWIVALQSSVTQPWTSSEIKVVFNSPSSLEEFQKYQRAMDYLTRTTNSS
jgi:hypothetical protein